MRTYESIFIVHPEVVGDDLTAVIDKFTTILSDRGADVLKVENWGTRTLAYQVKKQSKGCYILVIFDAEPSVIAEFERRMRIDEKVIKFQTIILEGGYEAPAVEAAPEEAPAEDAEATDADSEAPAASEAAAEESTEES